MARERGFYVDTVERTSTAGADALWAAVEGLGGERGWHGTDRLWFLRALPNRASLPPSRLRHRENPDRLAEGRRLDWWTVEALERGRHLRLRSLVRMPGEAWLDIALLPGPAGTVRYRQTTVFRPAGPAGHLYWYAMLVPHRAVLGRLADDVLRAAAG
ncbi:DUF2867 domain-containing protein [Kocuria flava]|uniref:DUF2867 domain-containing protein n=1 Tax=Kocuria flava TaxID=446860 RepID=UPI001FF2959C|nr:DUF2867 domain-containing protein [Kocuria flava]MCJ8504233.1 DUF2867 domain-containing protein [Kocuria flava]